MAHDNFPITPAPVIALAADHAGWELKDRLAEHLRAGGYDVVDLGTNGPDSVDYPDFGAALGEAVAARTAELGVAVCGSGIGIAMAAGKVAGIRAATVHDETSARLAREHNDANVLCLGARLLDADLATGALDAFLGAAFEGGRHEPRVRKIDGNPRSPAHPRSASWAPLADPEIEAVLEAELERQMTSLQLIASENFASPAVMAATGSVLTNKYSEGYPRRRYYGGNANADTAEQLAIDRVKELFGAEHANVQPHSGSQANAAVYLALLDTGDTVMGMSLDQGGHLTHGSPVNVSGRLYNFVSYGLTRGDERIDYDAMAELAREHRPKLIVAGATAYPRRIDPVPFREVCDEIGAVFMFDAAHIAGLIVGGVHINPVPYADIVTFTTHKTMRGPRGGTILCTQEYAKRIDSAVFPGSQGGPLDHAVAAKAVGFAEAARPQFAQYQARIVENAAALADALGNHGFRLVSGGTDNHLLLIDLRTFDADLTGKVAQEALDAAGVTLNRNSIPDDPRSPFVTSGLRMGTPSVTTQGMGPAEMARIAEFTARVLRAPDDEAIITQVRAEVAELCAAFPPYNQ
ncbi:ribose 5-phosphate isomerase B [Candidatus Poriferisodalis sp.]|uniref:ribose 5-phosphate isomerase B n=1 Tax=Candidatus Poriferisodalis sp. TaxID=3101277 RepID=UPI003AF8276B